MTTEEAIQLLGMVVPMTAVTQQGFERFLQARKMAMDALKKQIPMKAVGTHYAHMRCPSCNHRIPSGGGSSSRRRDNWCNYCGQKIDWSENNETN